MHGLRSAEAMRTALVLAQGGEFAFVLLTAGVSGGLMAAHLADMAVLVVSLSMALTPLLVGLGDRLLREETDHRPFDAIDQDHAPLGIGMASGEVAFLAVVLLREKARKKGRWHIATRRGAPMGGMDAADDHRIRRMLGAKADGRAGVRSDRIALARAMEVG